MQASGNVRFENVVKRFGTVTAVDKVSLEMRGGELLTFLGPSGSGKSTLLSMVLGIFPPDEGEIYLDGRPITSVPINKRNIGMVFQNYALFPHMTVRGNVAFPLEMRGMARAEIDRRVAEMISLVRLDGMGERYARQLSGGQQQRVATARALAASPPLVLMDEPLGALDRKLREEMQFEIRSLQSRLGITTLYVTHDQGEAIAISDRIAVMNHGRVQQIGAPKELFESPANVFVAGFLGNANLFRAHVEQRSGGQCRLRLEKGPAILADTPSATAVTEGGPAWVMIRPERLVLAANSPADPRTNACTATIRDVVYGGTAMKYTVALDEGLLVQVEMPAHDLPTGLEVGARLSLRWRIADTRVLPAETA